MGDTATAKIHLARALVDPATTSLTADSLRRLVNTSAESDGDTLLASARDEMIRRTLEESIRRTPLLHTVELLDLDGKRSRISLTGTLTFVAFWSRYCSYSVEQLPALQQLAKQLAARGVRVLLVTDDDDPAAIATWLKTKGFELETLLDVDRDAHNAFGNQDTPTYILLDDSGTVRFSGHSPAPVMRQLIALSRAH